MSEKDYIVGRIELGRESWAKPEAEGRLEVIDLNQIKREAFAAGVRAMREAAARLACPICADGVKAEGIWHRNDIGGLYPCHARAIRELPDPKPESA